MTTRSQGIDPVTGKVPLWVDVFSALWIVIATLSFAVEILMEMHLISPESVLMVVAGQYAYAAVIFVCALGGGLALVRSLVKEQ